MCLKAHSPQQLMYNYVLNPKEVYFLVTRIISDNLKATTGVKWTDLVSWSLLLIITLPTDISMLNLYRAKVSGNI